MRPISHEKKTHLDKSCVTMTDFMDKIYEKTELSDVICEEFSKSSSLISKARFEKKQSVLKSPMQLRIYLQRSNFNDLKSKFCKNKTKIALPAQYSMSFPDKHPEALYILVSLKLHIGNYIRLQHSNMVEL